MFFALYSVPYKSKIFTLFRVEPQKPFPPTQNEKIIEVSPNYIEIYEQAFISEKMNLGQIAGIGYRKALEFLIKDFCIWLKPDDKDAIKGKLLGQVISDHVGSDKIKDCARRAAWLGNDEAHYVRRWQDKDINDLKVLLKLVCHWVEDELLTEEYRQSMPD